MPQIPELIILPNPESKFDKAVSDQLRNYIFQLARILNKGLTIADNFDTQGLSSSGTDVTINGNLTVIGIIIGSNLSGTNTGDQDLSSYALTSALSNLVTGPATATDNAIARYDATTGKLIQNSGATIDDSDNITTQGKVNIGTPTTAITDGDLKVGASATNQIGLVVQTKASPTKPAFEIQDSTGRPAVRFETSGNSSMRINQKGTMATASYDGFVLSVQNIGDTGEGSWLEILNSGGANKGAFFGMAGDQFQLFNWQGGDIEFWTYPTASDGFTRFTMDKNGNFGIAGGLEYGWSHGWGGGKGILAIGNYQTAPTTSLTNAAAIYSDAGSLWVYDSDTTATRLGTRVVALTDGATPALNAKLGNVFTLSAAGDRTIAVPSNPKSGQKITIRHTASSADRTLALNTGTGGFRFGTTITGLTSTTSGLTDYIECLYNSTANKWDVISYVKGF